MNMAQVTWGRIMARILPDREVKGLIGSLIGGGDAERLAELFRGARQAMRQLDDALESLGSPRNSEKRLDRAPAPVPSIPIFDPAKLSY